MSLGKRLRAQLDHAELTVYDLHAITGLPSSLIFDVLADDVWPSPGELRKLANALGTTYEQLAGVSDPGLRYTVHVHADRLLVCPVDDRLPASDLLEVLRLADALGLTELADPPPGAWLMLVRPEVAS